MNKEQQYAVYYSPNFGTRVVPINILPEVQTVKFSSDYPFVVLMFGNQNQVFNMIDSLQYSVIQSMLYIYDLSPAHAVQFLTTCAAADLIQPGEYEFKLA